MRLQQSFRAAVCAIIIALCLFAGLAPTQSAVGQVTEPVKLRGAAAIKQLKQDGQYEALQAALDRERFSVSRAENTPLGRAAWHAPNPAAGYNAYITESGVSIAISDKSFVSLSLRSIGYGAAMQAVAPGQVSGDRQMIDIAREDGVREWYINGPDGLEQGFTLAEPPGARQAGEPLRLALQVSQEWQAEASEDGQRVTLRNAEGQAVDYSKLVVRDQMERKIPARLTVANEQIVIEVEDSEAIYPLIIDPLFSFQQKLTAADGAAGDLFGHSVALSGNTVAVGAPFGDVNTNANRGSVYVFVCNGTGWSFQQKLSAYDGEAEDLFGKSVALDGDTLVVGAHLDDIDRLDQGSAYVFTRNGTVWTFQQKLTAHDGGTLDFFGYSVALDGNTLAVGAHGDFAGVAVDQGSVYVFVNNGGLWSFQQRLTAYDAEEADAFGVSVALDGDTVAVGAPGKYSNQGSVYLFTRSGTVWSFQQQLISYNPGSAKAAFGFSVALDSDTLVVGAPWKDSNKGLVYVFKRSSGFWTEQKKLSAFNNASGDYFGNAVALSGDMLVVGAPGKKMGVNPNQGSAYVFVFGDAGWTFKENLPAQDGVAEDFFGNAVAISNDLVIVGADSDKVGVNNDQGSVYVFYRTPCAPLTFWPFSLFNGITGIPYQRQITVSGGAGPHQFTISDGAIPPGLSLSSSGLLSGTPTTTGDYQFTISVKDLDSLCSSSRAYSIKVTPCPTFTLDPPDMPDGSLGSPYSLTLEVYASSSTYSFLVKSGLPHGLSLSAEGVLSGIPTQTGYFPFTVYITAANGCTSSWGSSITITESGSSASVKRRAGDKR